VYEQLCEATSAHFQIKRGTDPLRFCEDQFLDCLRRWWDACAPLGGISTPEFLDGFQQPGIGARVSGRVLKQQLRDGVDVSVPRRHRRLPGVFLHQRPGLMHAEPMQGIAARPR
jgi:hypothetical protein